GTATAVPKRRAPGSIDRSIEIGIPARRPRRRRRGGPGIDSRSKVPDVRRDDVGAVARAVRSTRASKVPCTGNHRGGARTRSLGSVDAPGPADALPEGELN